MKKKRYGYNVLDGLKCFSKESYDPLDPVKIDSLQMNYLDYLQDLLKKYEDQHNLNGQKE